MAKRKIINIDQDKCNGCRLCIPNCPEGAIQMIDGKARLVSDLFCDGLGACLGHCPQGAITIEEREAEPYNDSAARHHHDGGSCPGSKMMSFERPVKKQSAPAGQNESELGQWPIQINLVPPHAPYLNGADLLVAADCVPFAYADFHNKLLKGRVVLVGCPKLDDIEKYREKIAVMLKDNDVKSVTYAHMEVPCCSGLIGVIKGAITSSGKNIPFKEAVIGIQGNRLK